MTYLELRILKAYEVAAAALTEVAQYGGTAAHSHTTAVAAREQERLLEHIEVLRAEFAGAAEV